MSEGAVGFCINCGATLDGGHRYCARCGTQRWVPEPDSASQAPTVPGRADLPAPARSALAPAEQRPPPPVPGTPPLVGRDAVGTRLGLLPWIYAAGAIFLLVQASQFLAYCLSPTWRGQQLALLAARGVPPGQRLGWFLVEAVVPLTLLLAGAVLHALGFYGLRRGRRWGWLSAVIVAAFWCLGVFGIPVLWLLSRPNVRRSYGVD
ncbi:MAG: zinc ribbon domain-containing protein [Candidatus Dormibacter sp.]|uniref:zinc ribbon domain-containing protein n=1 Tax=Candidatus Dormibacter sp. TaxID=2973982 RepID=UPI003D9AE540